MGNKNLVEGRRSLLGVTFPAMLEALGGGGGEGRGGGGGGGGGGGE